MTHTLVRFAALWAIVFVAPLATAGDSPEAAWEHPRWANPMESFSGSLTMPAGLPATEVRVTAEFLGDQESTVVASPVDGAPGRYAFSLPAFEPYGGTGGGEYAFYAQIQTPDGVVVTPKQSVPLAYAEELDITGNPPVVLTYPLEDESHLVRYIPCCNILGGAIVAERIPVNPQDTAEGLPDSFLSDFVVLQPDGLSASTAGLYFRFSFDAEKSAAQPNRTPAVYMWEANRWVEYYAYDIEPDGHYVDFHCPDGGLFVLGLKK